MSLLRPYFSISEYQGIFPRAISIRKSATRSPHTSLDLIFCVILFWSAHFIVATTSCKFAIPILLNQISSDVLNFIINALVKLGIVLII
jgi:hypothetical protein